MPDDELPITDLQRSKLLDFVEHVDRSLGDSTFDRSDPLTDIQLVILALMAARAPRRSGPRDRAVLRK
jgi:hypothetical protein